MEILKDFKNRFEADVKMNEIKAEFYDKDDKFYEQQVDLDDMKIDVDLGEKRYGVYCKLTYDMENGTKTYYIRAVRATIDFHQ